ncbi:MAG TPA: diacylglycerol kinase family protein [Gaiellaceae bacterium]|jgi:YegS/Rv2252/BmrU family lipid kinase|nr:diacylglycerol kinase family protein [Gaiellaceae bacterium]
MSTASTVFLVNPASDNGATGKRWPELAHRAELLGLSGETLFSERPGHLIELARGAVERGAELIVVAGGDGTLNEAVNGVAGSGVTLATIPLGTGMDFGRTYGIPTRFDDAVRVALDGETRTIDAGRVRYRTWAGEDAERWFANVGSVGMSGAVAQRANGMSKALGGKVTFFYALTRVFFEWQNTDVTVTFDDGERRGLMHDVIVANGMWHGGGMKVAPDALPDDGMLDVVLIGDVSKADFLTTAPKLYKGKHVHHPKVDVLRTRRVTVDAAEHLPIEVEGEQVGTTPATFEAVAGALRVRVPTSTAAAAAAVSSSSSS